MNDEQKILLTARFGVAYRQQKTAWKIAPYPLRATHESALKLITWLKTEPRFKVMDMRVVSVALFPNGER